MKTTEKLRFHIVSLPHTQTTKEYTWCAYTEKVRKFCNMMTSIGHEVYLYAGEENEANVTEHIPVVFLDEVDEWFGHLDWQKDLFPADGWDPTNPWWQIGNDRAIAEITKRAQPNDMLGTIMGRCHASLVDAFPEMLPCEWGIGYEGTYAQFRVFESYAWMHTVHGIQKDSNGRNFDAVIPNSFELEDFPLGDGLGDESGEYFLFLGRVVLRKGPHIAAEVCSRLDERLVVAGQGVWKQEPDALYGLDDVVVKCPKVEYAGVVGAEARARLLGGAKAVFMPTLYIEPFGGVACEAMLCGTPVISTDWGAFTETIQPGLSGFRCRTLADFMLAAKEAPYMDRKRVREWALRYTTDVVKWEYDAYFKRLATLRGEGWYALPKGF